MKKMRIIMVAAVLMMLLIPTAVSAAGTFYCSALKSSGGVGTYANPWACSTDAQLNTVIYVYVCYQYGGGHLYQVYENSYIYYRIERVPVVTGQYECRITFRGEYPGFPPDTGPDIPLPLILGAAAVAGGLLLVAGITLRRRRSEA